MSPRMRLVIGVVLALVGLVWALQGFGVVGGSGMSGQGIWAVIGSFLVVVGVVVALSSRRRA
ncbi:hypothetical protein [Pedococcus sp.]|uniref:hypothetical protein n=1 Tax=Pedococcus sp. TaxID=2860345 RepID=UPI002E105339|nr:hypothetical protein [Pedococcus sp.]